VSDLRISSDLQFQARPFHERLGYEVVADIPDYSRGHDHHVLKKTLE
jgi:hypothetical protein